jgi:hypothetical protein
MIKIITPKAKADKVVPSKIFGVLPPIFFPVAPTKPHATAGVSPNKIVPAFALIFLLYLYYKYNNHYEKKYC